MLVKIKDGKQTYQFDSRSSAIAILLDQKDKDAISNMPEDERLILSAPLRLMQDKAARTWQWALTGWDGAEVVAMPEIKVTDLRKF